ncbi:MAG: TolC family protein [Betaproteobacteria bacterium]|nr:MAG: TolC family protein [Betaproteobacteria bacterium]
MFAFVMAAGPRAQELTLEEAQRLAETAQPQLNARRSAIEAAGEAAAAARELPDPKLKLGFLNVPIEGDEAFSLDAEPMTMAMIGVVQAFPRQSKRMLRGEVYSLVGERGASELAASRLRLRRDAALGWLQAWLAERALELIARQQAEARIEIESLVIALRNNRANAAEVSAARVELELLRDREQAQLGMKHAARARLARWVGERAAAPLPVALPEKPQPANTDSLARDVATHPRLEAAQVQARIAETEARLANLSTRPDWRMEVAYGHRAPKFGSMISLQFQIDMPILQDRRQNRSIAARLAEARQARELREDELRQMRAAALQLHAQWESADARSRLFEQRVLPEARKRLRAATASYRSGKSELGDVLEARRALLDLELESLMRRGEVVRLLVELEYFEATGE